MGKIKSIIVDSDPSWTLEEWASFIEQLIEKYGDKSVLYTDAGYSNVSLRIIEID